MDHKRETRITGQASQRTPVQASKQNPGQSSQRTFQQASQQTPGQPSQPTPRQPAQQTSGIQVAVGLVHDAYGRVLITQRRADAHLGGLWEFPGGKCRQDETAYDALKRELAEEVGIEVLAATHRFTLPYAYAERKVVLQVFQVQLWSGSVQACEGQPLYWATEEDLIQRSFPDANRPILAAARLPPVYWITPSPRSSRVVPELVGRLVEHLARGDVRLLQIRAPNLERKDFLRFATPLLEQAHSMKAEMLVNAPLDWLKELPEAGWHLTEARLLALAQRREFDRGLDNIPRWLGASVHNGLALQRAAEIGVDFVCFSPVRATQTHPGAPTLGVNAFAQLCAQSRCPVYALGGMHMADLPALRARGAQGIAAINGLWPKGVSRANLFCT